MALGRAVHATTIHFYGVSGNQLGLVASHTQDLSSLLHSPLSSTYSIHVPERSAGGADLSVAGLALAAMLPQVPR